MSQRVLALLITTFRALVFGVLLLPIGLAQGADQGTRPQTGLIWLHSPLPAVFPLQVKTAPGRDHHLTLLEHDTRKVTLTAYIRGGDFFRVLVPPGSYRLHFAYGAVWQGEDRLFGMNTRTYEMDEPLEFATRGLGTKAGHLVDLRGLIETKEASMIAPLAICQTLRREFEAAADTPFDPGFEVTGLPRLIPRYRIYSRVCDPRSKR